MKMLWLIMSLKKLEYFDGTYSVMHKYTKQDILCDRVEWDKGKVGWGI